MSEAWDPKIPNQQVRCIDNPSRMGVTTGVVTTAGGFTLVQVRFGASEVSKMDVDFLEPVVVGETALDLARKGNFGDAQDLRRLLTFQKIRGDLTSVFYSMESSNTDFYAHQFKPVLKFIESITGRILIADEVGLGKTMEAMYIWKELRAREHASRLLIVCPSMLRDKWQTDLEVKFGIEARIVGAVELADDLEKIAPRIASQSFVYIASIEGLRPPKEFENSESSSPRSRLARLFDSFSGEVDDNALFDLVIIDEAHYLRNPETANNRLGRLLRDASRNLALLTATPIQIGAENLYQLLKLLDPEQFYSMLSFNESLAHNRPYTTALRALWRNPPNLELATAALARILENSGEGKEEDPAIRRIHDRVSSSSTLENEDRVEYGRLLESRSFLSRYMTRSRKREVLEKRVERSPQVCRIDFTEKQLHIYNAITAYIRQKAQGSQGVSTFALIARQRQLASCYPAALRTWAEKDILTDFMYENLGGEFDPDEVADPEGDTAAIGLDRILKSYDSPEFEEEDQKYLKLKEIIIALRERSPDEKIVLFAFFRGTLTYIARRLEKDGIRAVLIMGGMGHEKTEIIERFRTDPSITLLLSSEVGSEGIDLQFCHTLVNYDLPWNPMRIEQRIGRLDRLGQKADRISIINFVVGNSIEDDILYRLYERIGVFKESIGEIEEILGEISESLIKAFLDPSLTDEERRRNAEDAALAANNRRSQMSDLENYAANFMGFSDYLLSEIEDSRASERWVTAEELRLFAEDFLSRHYPGTSMRKSGKASHDVELSLSGDARYEFGKFLEENHLVGKTRIASSRSPVFCRFDMKTQIDLHRGMEAIDTVHPLVRWMRHVLSLREGNFHPVSAMIAKSAETGVTPGSYVYAVQLWGFHGLRLRQYLAYKAIRIEDASTLDSASAERLVVVASRTGRIWKDLAYDRLCEELPDWIVRCENALEEAFAGKILDFDAENRSICIQQERTAGSLSARKCASLEERIARDRESGNLKVIPMTEGKLRAEQDRLSAILKKISGRSRLNPESRSVANGIIRIE